VNLGAILRTALVRVVVVARSELREVEVRLSHALDAAVAQGRRDACEAAGANPPAIAADVFAKVVSGLHLIQMIFLHS